MSRFLRTPKKRDFCDIVGDLFKGESSKNDPKKAELQGSRFEGGVSQRRDETYREQPGNSAESTF